MLLLSPDSLITLSSSHSSPDDKVRLEYNGKYCAWVAHTSDTSPWVIFDLQQSRVAVGACCHQRPTHETVRASAGLICTIIPSCLSRSRTPHRLAAIDKPIRVVLTKSKMAQPSVTCHSDHASDCFTCQALNSNFHHLT